MSCKIHLENPGVYAPGETVKGKVVCRFQENTYVKDIQCRLSGKEQINFHDNEGNYSGNNIFLDKSMSNKPENNMMHPGVYECAFTFKLPSSNIPSSYLDDYGSIQYNVSANICTPPIPLGPDSKDRVEIRVKAPITFDSKLSFPIFNQNEDENVICCFPVDSTTLSVALEKDTFVLGEEMRVRVDLNNKGNQEVTEVKVRLVSNILYKTTSASKLNKEELVKASDIGIPAGRQQTYFFNLKLPETHFIPNFRGCSLLKHWGSLHIEALFPSFHENLNLTTSLQNIKLCPRHVPVPAVNNNSSIGFSKNIVKVSEDASLPNLVPVAKAPSVIHPPTGSNLPYPLGNPIGHPLHPMPFKSSLINNDHDTLFNREFPVPSTSSLLNDRLMPHPMSTAPSAPFVSPDDFNSADDNYLLTSEPPPPSYDETMRQSSKR